MSKTKRVGRDRGEALLFRAFGLAGGRGRPLEVNCLVGPTHPQRIEAVRLLEGFTGKQGIFIAGVDREAEAASEATGTAGAEDHDAASGDDDSPEYYMEWIEASSPRLLAAKRKQWQALLTSARPFARPRWADCATCWSCDSTRWPWRQLVTGSSHIATARP
jgi:hypothetical protein